MPMFFTLKGLGGFCALALVGTAWVTGVSCVGNGTGHDPGVLIAVDADVEGPGPGQLDGGFSVAAQTVSARTSVVKGQILPTMGMNPQKVTLKNLRTKKKISARVADDGFFEIAAPAGAHYVLLLGDGRTIWGVLGFHKRIGGGVTNTLRFDEGKTGAMDLGNLSFNKKFDDGNVMLAPEHNPLFLLDSDGDGINDFQDSDDDNDGVLDDVDDDADGDGVVDADEDDDLDGDGEPDELGKDDSRAA